MRPPRLGLASSASSSAVRALHPSGPWPNTLPLPLAGGSSSLSALWSVSGSEDPDSTVSTEGGVFFEGLGDIDRVLTRGLASWRSIIASVLLLVRTVTWLTLVGSSPRRIFLDRFWGSWCRVDRRLGRVLLVLERERSGCLRGALLGRGRRVIAHDEGVFELAVLEAVVVPSAVGVDALVIGFGLASMGSLLESAPASLDGLDGASMGASSSCKTLTKSMATPLRSSLISVSSSGVGESSRGDSSVVAAILDGAMVSYT